MQLLKHVIIGRILFEQTEKNYNIYNQVIAMRDIEGSPVLTVEGMGLVA
jgi:hypothetical protein